MGVITKRELLDETPGQCLIFPFHPDFALISEHRLNWTYHGQANERLCNNMHSHLFSMHHFNTWPGHSIVLQLTLVSTLTHPLSTLSEADPIKPPNEGPTRSTEHWQLNNSAGRVLLLICLHCIFSGEILFIADALILSSIPNSHQ